MPQSNPTPREDHPEIKGERNPARSLPLKQDAAKNTKDAQPVRESKNKHIEKASTVTDGEDG